MKSLKCTFCEGSGRHEEPINKDIFNQEFDRLDDKGYLNMDECRKEALKKSGYTVIECPRCNGTGLQK